jgi:hypothetical protein
VTDTQTDTDAQERLLLVLDGLVPLHLMRLGEPGELARAQREASADGGTADVIAESGDRLTASGNFRGDGEHRTRGKVLAAMAQGLALGAMQPGGVTWAGAHWCTAAHDACPNARAAS